MESFIWKAFGMAPHFVLKEHRIGAEKTFQRGNRSWPGS
ncbi:hypothetical protein AFE_0440 [Acidithiobacillus ferrooxidans ATCC 23270]|uniref:Uncharacterized protein n=1 Tax=Acidithiobacillus ferrooxidans (strain ATCC 23270 / DSM 14882 / CIP 104768 / NCIMB 8455) TaxID=243159 RepID=B7J4I3_ACIF2|nr:hypothetical protein AFE_0440 [Acidithiobacillus ferrooxidans ATCC 23270]